MDYNTLKAVNKLWQPSFHQQNVVLIGDREADFFEHYAESRHNHINLIVRVQQKGRRVLYEGSEMKLADVLLQLKPLGEGTIKVWRRQEEQERIAIVEYYAATVTFPADLQTEAAGSADAACQCQRKVAVG